MLTEPHDKLLRLLIDQPVVSTKDAFTIYFGHCPSRPRKPYPGPCPSALSMLPTQVGFVRKYLKSIGIDLPVAKKNVGWSLSPADRQKLKDM